ncbi:MAG: hypothetical protein KC713_05475, partial [Candidatus Omnitrophica bacterium]|nr:hypothetical protein [Candidatus Omnitrophota bacterium]
MSMKIIIVFYIPLNQRDYQRFGVPIFLKNGFEVELWDITHVRHPAWGKHYTPPDFMQTEHLVMFHSRED